MKALIFALLLVAACAAQSHAGWFAEITFAPSASRGGSMVWRGDWVPSEFARPQHRSRNHLPSYGRWHR